MGQHALTHDPSTHCLLLHKEPSLKAWLELFVTNITVLEMSCQHVPNLECRDAESARTMSITRGPSTWYNHVIVVSRATSQERKGTETTGEQMSQKYTGDRHHRPWIQSYVMSAILNVMRWDTGSQWRVSRNVGVMWSFRGRQWLVALRREALRHARTQWYFLSKISSRRGQILSPFLSSPLPFLHRFPASVKNSGSVVQA